MSVLVGTLTVLELPQGYYSDLTGLLTRDVLAMFRQDDADFRARHPQTTPQPFWREMTIRPHDTAPQGYEWYVTNDKGLLQRHSANYDSSG